MKTIYLLFVVFIDSEGYETMKRVNDAKYNSMFECHVAKSYHKETDNIKFICLMKDCISTNNRNYIKISENN